jgi:hypothetical protein
MSNPDALDLLVRFYLQAFRGERLPEIEINRLFEPLMTDLFPMDDGLAPDEWLLLEILKVLPAGEAVPTSGVLAEVLHDMANAGFFDETENVGHALLQELRRERYRFVYPVCTPSHLAPLAIGGRHNLLLLSAEVQGTNICFVSGECEARHWVEAKRAANKRADELVGLLSAVGLAQFNLNLVSHGHTSPLSAVVTCPERSDRSEWEEICALSWAESERVWRTELAVPRLQLRRQTYTPLLVKDEEAEAEKRLRLVAKAFQARGPDARRVRLAARFLRKAEVTDSPGESCLFLATSLEALLYHEQMGGRQRSGQIARHLEEAVSFLVAGNHQQRTKAREVVRFLYQARSDFVHQGRDLRNEYERFEALSLTRRAIVKELTILSNDPPDTPDPGDD